MQNLTRLLSIEDVSMSSIVQSTYHYALAASGHESRSSFVSSQINPSSIRRLDVLGFDSFVDEGARLANDRHFFRKWNVAPSVIDNRDDLRIYRLLEDSCMGLDRLRVLIDYSSMTRFWYAAVLNWFRFRWAGSVAEVDFVYAPARYQSIIPRMEIQEILCVPGCEGSTASSGPSVAMIGLGFDGLAALCVLDDLEPDIIKPFIAAGGADDSYVDAVRVENREILERVPDEAVLMPLDSVEATVRLLSELGSPFSHGYSVSLIPVGPKPHVLACILLAMKFPQVACLHVSGRRQEAWQAEADGRMCGTRVVFRKSNR